MNRTLAAALLLTGASGVAGATGAQAAGIDLSLSDEAANLLVLFNPYQPYADGGSELAVGGFVSEQGDNLLQISLMAQSQRLYAGSLYRLGVGVKAVYGELDIPDGIVLDGDEGEKVGALGIGLQAGVLLAESRNNPVELVGEAFLAPSITSFTDAERYLEFAARLQVTVIPQAQAYFGYRSLSFETNDYDSLELDKGYHLGLKVSF